jgi:hypothetical protein
MEKLIALVILPIAVIIGYQSLQLLEMLFLIFFVLIAFLNILSKIPAINHLPLLKILIGSRNSFLSKSEAYLKPAYLLRIPITSGLVIFLFPLISNTLAKTFLQNLFALRSDWQIFLVIAASTLTSLMVVSLAKTILAIYDKRNNDRQIWRLFASLILVLPTWLSIGYNSFILSREDEIQPSGLIFGIILSIIFLIGTSLYEYRKNIPLLNKDRFRDLKFFSEQNLVPRRKKILLGQFLVGIVLYGIVIALYYPGAVDTSSLQEAPALLYVFLLIWIITLILGGLTLLFDQSFDAQTTDKIRSSQEASAGNISATTPNSTSEANSRSLSFPTPVLLFTILFFLLSYSAWKVDHYFELIPTNVTSDLVNYKEEFQQAIKNRLASQTNKDKTIVVVAASGGGIQASGWTAQVLTELQKEKDLGEAFINAIGLISSVSGGSVGTMFYLDQFQPGATVPNINNLDKIQQHATNDWLDAIGWGLAYPDLVRAIGLPLLNRNRLQDRAYALEKDWQKNLTAPTTLENWHKRVLLGEMPIPVFNSTLLENGRRFLISPMKFIPGNLGDYISRNNEDGIGKRKALDFKTLYANYDLNVTTAARLSAAFPYVTPMARNDRDNKIEIIDDRGQKVTVSQNYHMADGGYFDNFGQFTAVEWLDDLLSASRNVLNIKKVLLIQINGFADPQFQDQENGKKGLDVAILGPLQTLYSVKDSTQQARNIREFGLFSQRWKSENVSVKSINITFPFPTASDGYEPPLSWRLTRHEKDKLKDAWKDDAVQKAVTEIKGFWRSAL